MTNSDLPTKKKKKNVYPRLIINYKLEYFIGKKKEYRQMVQRVLLQMQQQQQPKLQQLHVVIP